MIVIEGALLCIPNALEISLHEDIESFYLSASRYLTAYITLDDGRFGCILVSCTDVLSVRLIAAPLVSTCNDFLSAHFV